MTTLTGGNLSILDEAGDLWITPSGIDKGALLPQDIMCLRADGSEEGPHKPSSELPFHRAIYARRPDLHAVLHAHSPALVTYSMARQIPDTRIIPQAHRVCGPVGYAPYARMGSQQLGDRLAEAFGAGHNVVLLENHGAAMAGVDLLEAFQRLETLDFCARTLIHARGLGAAHTPGAPQTLGAPQTPGAPPGPGEPSTLSDEQLALFDRRWNQLPEFVPATTGSRERELRQQIVEIVHRAYDRGLMISTEGVVSARVPAAGFVITPTGMDRRAIEIEDLVRVDGGRRETGKWPSRSVRLHAAIYARHPGIGSVITAQAPHITAYAIVDRPFDTKTIPESFVMLRHVRKVPFDLFYRQPEQVAARLSARTPVLIAQNDCVLTTGETILQAFDRLEVAEYSAQSLIDIATKVGSWVPIDEQDLRELEEMFGLE
jgi:L-fuculose-phosphate aldolase